MQTMPTKEISPTQTLPFEASPTKASKSNKVTMSDFLVSPSKLKQVDGNHGQKDFQLDVVDLCDDKSEPQPGSSGQTKTTDFVREHTYFPDKGTVKKHKSTASSQIFKTVQTKLQIYSCPVCTKDVKVRNLGDFNTHIDNCLSANELVIERPTSKKENYEHTESTTETGMTEKCERMDISGDDSKDDKPKIKTSDSSSRAGKCGVECSPEAAKCGDDAARFVCPVCGTDQPTESLDIFNRHVDDCLNKQAIKEMLQQDRAKS